MAQLPGPSVMVPAVNEALPVAATLLVLPPDVVMHVPVTVMQAPDVTEPSIGTRPVGSSRLHAAAAVHRTARSAR